MLDSPTTDLRDVHDSRMTAVEMAAVPRLRLLGAMYAIATALVMVILLASRAAPAQAATK